MVQISIRKGIAVSLVAILFLLVLNPFVSLGEENGASLNSPHNVRFLFQTKQPLDCAWSWDIADLNSTYSVPLEDYSSREYMKTEVQDGYVYIAKGANTPSQFLCINKATGNIAWEYSTERVWNTEKPFVCLLSDIILNYQNTICLMDKKTGEIKQTWNLENKIENNLEKTSGNNLYKNCYGVYASVDILLVKDYSQNIPVIKCFGNSDFDEIWTYSHVENSRIVGVKDEYLIILELSSTPDNTSLATLLSVSLEFGEQSKIVTWDDVCRLDYCINSQGIVLGVLSSLGEGSLFSLTYNETDEFEVSEIAESIPLISMEDYEKMSPTIKVEDENLGFRVFNQDESYYVAVSASVVQEQGKEEMETYNNSIIYERLFVYKYDKDGHSVWNKTFSSIEKSSGIVEDAFIQDDFLVLQFPYRTPFTGCYVYAFWLDLETGSLTQSFYDYYDYWLSGAVWSYPVFYPGIVLQTSRLNNRYMTHIQALLYNPETMIEKKDITLECPEVALEKLYHVPCSEDDNIDRLPPFTCKNSICFFQTNRNRRRGRTNIELFRYDVENEETLPTLSFTYRHGENDFDGLYLINDSLVLGHIDYYSEEIIVCFDIIIEEELIWEKEALFVDWICDDILFRPSDFEKYNHPTKGTVFTLFNPIEEEIINTIPFSNAFVDYIGTDGNLTILFQRNGMYVSMFNLKSGILEDEIVLSDTERYRLQLCGDHLFYFSGEGLFGCLDIHLKKHLWERDMGNYNQYFYVQNLYTYFHIIPLDKQEALGYSTEGCIVFDMNNGKLLREYSNAEWQIRSSCETDSNCPLFKLYSHDKTTTCLQLNIDSAEQSEILAFPEIDYPALNFTGKNDYFTNVVCFVIHGRQYFVYYGTNHVNFVCICAHPLQKETLQNNDVMDIGTDISNYLYWTPYLLFQTSIGELNSTCGLVAFNTEDGSLTKIHKGFHERVFIQDEKLYFFQYGKCYSCPLGEFDSVEKSLYEKKLPVFASGGSVNPYKNYQEGVPEEYSSLDLYYINKLVYGDFTSQDKKDLMFITGDDACVKIGIMEEKNGLVVPSIVGSFQVEESELNSFEEGGCQFYQIVVLDIDNDGLDELIILTKEYLFVCDYSSDSYKIKMQEFLFDGEESEQHEQKELILVEGSLYLQYYRVEYYKTKKELKQFCLNYNPTLEDVFSLERCFVDLPSVLFKHQYSNKLAPFQFLEKPVQNEKPYVVTVKNTCMKHPKTSMPPNFEINEDMLNEKELEYCQKRNNYVQKFISFLEDGNDPFGEIRVQSEFFGIITEFSLSLSPEDETERLVTDIFSLDVLQQNGKDYVLLRIADERKQKHMILLSSELKPLDWKTNLFLDLCNMASVIVSEEQSDYFWIQLYDEKEDPMYFLYGRLANEKMNCVVRTKSYGIIQKDDSSYYTVSDTNSVIADMMCGYDFSNVYDLQYVDPFSGASVNSLFLTETFSCLEALYSTFLMNQEQYVNYGHSGSVNTSRFIELPDGRVKHLDVEEAAISLLKLEYFMRKHNLFVYE